MRKRRSPITDFVEVARGSKHAKGKGSRQTKLVAKNRQSNKIAAASRKANRRKK